MAILIKCDSCDFETAIDADDCPQLLELVAGGDPLDGDGAETIADWHACATCRDAFFAKVPVEVKRGRAG